MGFSGLLVGLRGFGVERAGVRLSGFWFRFCTLDLRLFYNFWYLRTGTLPLQRSGYY